MKESSTSSELEGPDESELPGFASLPSSEDFEVAALTPAFVGFASRFVCGALRSHFLVEPSLDGDLSHHLGQDLAFSSTPLSHCPLPQSPLHSASPQHPYVHVEDVRSDFPVERSPCQKISCSSGVDNLTVSEALSYVSTIA
jgi:hypothetical protein